MSAAAAFANVSRQPQVYKWTIVSQSRHNLNLGQSAKGELHSNSLRTPKSATGRC